MKVSKDGAVTDDDGRQIGRVARFTHRYSIFTGPPGSDMIFVDGRCGWGTRPEAVAALQKHVAEPSGSRDPSTSTATGSGV